MNAEPSRRIDSFSQETGERNITGIDKSDSTNCQKAVKREPKISLWALSNHRRALGVQAGGVGQAREEDKGGILQVLKTTNTYVRTNLLLKQCRNAELSRRIDSSFQKNWRKKHYWVDKSDSTNCQSSKKRTQDISVGIFKPSPSAGRASWRRRASWGRRQMRDSTSTELVSTNICPFRQFEHRSIGGTAPA